jgi:hypothetical protein
LRSLAQLESRPAFEVKEDSTHPKSLRKRVNAEAGSPQRKSNLVKVEEIPTAER